MGAESVHTFIMEKILSDEELAALLQLCRSDMESGSVEGAADEMLSLDDSDFSRHFFRLKQSFDATIKIGAESHHVKVTNLGLGGIFVIGDFNLPVGKRVQVSIDLPDPEATILVRSYVCWHKKIDHRLVGLGMRFPVLKTDHVWLIISNMKQALRKSNAA